MAISESLTGLMLIVSPSALASLLLASSLDAPASLIVGRVAGAGLLSLGLACWFARSDETSRATTGLMRAMLVYNVAASLILAYAGVIVGLSGALLWPAILAHLALAIECGASIGLGRAGPPLKNGAHPG
jgi:hypothetical protein